MRNQQELDIINLQQYGDALRNTGYKNIESAAAEIVDNSIEADADTCFVIVSESIPTGASKNMVTEIAFLDDGHGMGKDALQGALRIGYGTKRDRTGMGRFGVGLPQSSLYATPRVEVYSWQTGQDSIFRSYLDINEVETGSMTGFPIPVECELPGKYKLYIKHSIFSRDYDFSQHGTLVVWRNCDNVYPQSTSALFNNRFEPGLGKRFRHYLEKHEIVLISAFNESLNRQVLPNDPLFLNENNIRLGPNDNAKIGQVGRPDGEIWTETLFEEFVPDGFESGTVDIDVDYRDEKTYEKKIGKVTVRFSSVKDRFYSEQYLQKDPGSTDEGKWVKRLEGISIVRANREIDFGNFDFYFDTNEPTHRWWGLEISFDPSLDEVFNVANNKQHVELYQLDDSDYEDDDVKPIWIQLNSKIPNAIKEMYKKNKERRKGTRTPTNPTSGSETIINDNEPDDKETQGSKSGKGHTEEEKIVDIKETLDVPAETASSLLNNKLQIVWKQSGEGNRFIDYDFKFGNSYCYINEQHLFYKNYLQEIIEKNPDARTAFELFAGSYVRAIDEAKDSDKEAYDKLHDEWMDKLKVYIKEQLGK